VLKRLILVRGAEIALFVVLGALPLAVDSPYALGLLTLLAIWGVALIGLDVTVGYLGQINLAQAAMLGLGGYLAGIAAVRYGVGIPLAVVLSGAFCTAVGAVLALPALRLEGPQFALATLSFTALCATALNELEWLTNGAQGLQIPRPMLLGHALDARAFFWLCIAILAARICQSTVHVSHVQTDTLVAVRFSFFSVQLASFLALIVMAAIHGAGKP